ncbi:Ctr copper transporter [Sphaerosporella brunnea]|uniref:Copper transport protein n=1 Tax=Sphaerosporella brunnea TaxID=1250544 RepID=A0A5J5F2P4_9PEZI|nr:Ctr copper transporter [Sphaerosporella brunnea]
MLWNWHTIDACFLANTWHVRTKGQFAGSCIGVFFLVLALEFVRRAQREYDRSIVSQWQGPGDKETVQAKESGRGSANPPRRPTLLQHLVRCLFFTSQLCAAYIVRSSVGLYAFVY